MTSKFRLSKVGCPIRRSAGQRLFAPHHSLSQRTTSFIASYRQGIHQMPLGHLIALISNARHFIFKTRTPLEGRPAFLTTRQGEHCSERPEVEINPDDMAVTISRRAARNQAAAPGVSPLYDVHYHPLATWLRKFVLFQDCPQHPSQRSWWSQTGSNRRPHACKARALPAELWPRSPRAIRPSPLPMQVGSAGRQAWWAWEDLNFRPHAYQARALTN